MKKLVTEFKDGKFLTVRVWETSTGYLGNLIDTIGGSSPVGEVIEIAADWDVDGVLRSLGYGPEKGRIVRKRFQWN